MNAKTTQDVPREVAIEYLINKILKTKKKELERTFNKCSNGVLEALMNENYPDEHTEYKVVGEIN